MVIRDMTTGNPLKHLLMFAIPLLIGNIFQQVYSMVDTMVAGYTLGDGAIAAIGATHFLNGVLISTANALNNGFAIVVTQSFGSGNRDRMRRAIAGQMMLNLGFDLLLTVLSLIFLVPMLKFLAIPDSIFQDSYNYMFVLLAGVVGTIMYNMFSSILRAVGNSRTPLYFLIICSILNVILDLLFIIQFGMGVRGAALATIISQIISGILCGGYLWKNYREILPKKEDFRTISGELIKDLITTGLAMAMMICVVDFGSIFYSRANNSLGELYITSYSAAYKYVGIFMQPIGTMSTACSTFIGQNFGAKKKERITYCLKLILVVELIYSALAILVAFGFGPGLIRFLTNTSDEAVIREGAFCLRAHIAFYPFLGFLLPLRAALQSMRQKTAPLISSFIELGIKIITSFFVVPVIGFVGTCFTEPVCWVVMVAFLIVYYLIRKKKIFAVMLETA